MSGQVIGPALAAFDAQAEAEEAGVMLTPEQWASGKGCAGPSPRARGSTPPSFGEPDTVRMTQEQLRAQADACRTRPRRQEPETLRMSPEARKILVGACRAE